MVDRKTTELRAFLRSHRERVKPEEVGLPRLGRRRVIGLRRDEVAELAGVSAAWYTRFEMGRAQLSISALRRVAVALQLTVEERRCLLALARPDVAAIGDRHVEDVFSGLGSSLRGLRDLARRCASVSSIAELADAATQAVHALAGSASLAYMREHDPDADELRVVGVCGPNGHALAGHRQACAGVAYAMAHFREGRPFAETDLRQSPCVELRTRVQRVGVYAYHSQPILRRHELDFLLGIALREARAPMPWQIEGLEAAAAIVELTLAR